MKWFILSILFTYSIHFDAGKKEFPSVQLEIYSGKTEWGEKAIVLTREGMILRSSPLEGRNRTEFLSIKELDPQRMRNLNDFLARHDQLITLKSSYCSELNGFALPRKYVLRSYSDNYIHEIKDCDYYRYSRVDSIDRKVLDSLVQLTNELIPERKRQTFSFKEFSGQEIIND